MNIDYLKNVIIPQRKKEIENGENAATRQPIYIVFDLTYYVFTGHDDSGWLSGELLNRKGKDKELGYIDNNTDLEEREFIPYSDSLEDDLPHNYERVTKIYTDKLVALFLTRKAAKEYLKYQSHNMSSEAYIYTAYSGYRNIEMDKFLNNE